MKKIAIIGGGVSGLTSAFYASKMLKNVAVTVYESSA